MATTAAAPASTLNPYVTAGLSLANTAGGIGSTLLTNHFNRKEAEKQREWNEQMAEKQNEWNLNMWNMTNQYNSPSAQVERLRDAGLNPLYYGLDGSSADGLQAAQPLGYERAAMANMQNPIAQGIDAALKVAQVSNIQADTAKKNNENVTETTRREKLQADIDEVRQEIKNKIANEKLTDTQRERLQKDIDWLDRLNEATINEKKSAAALNDTQKKRIEELLEGEKLIQVKTIEDFEHKWKKIDAEIAKMAKETGLLEKDIENYALNHANNGFMGSGISLTNIIRAVKNIKPRKFDTDASLTDIETEYNID